MTRSIRTAAVIGSGTMGAGIAAHLANTGINVLLYDVVPRELTAEEKRKGVTTADKQVRNRLSQKALERLTKQKPAPLASQKILSLIEPCNLTDDMERIKDVDWVIEAIVEDLAAKQELMKTLDKICSPRTIVSTNTSGISVNKISEGCTEEFKSNFLGTHFFNPPRYLKLLELIPTAQTNQEITGFMKTFGEEVLGKGVVICRDTPNFIANRIGTYGLLVTVREMVKGNFSVGEIDSVTGTLIGRPKSATFRTLDVVGLDTFLHVARNVYESAEGNEKELFRAPAFLKTMVEKGWIGSKSGQGFYLKKKEERGTEIAELNLKSFAYEQRKKLRTPSIERAKQQKALPDRLKTLLMADDRGGQLIWSILKPLLIYSAEKVNEISETLLAVDEAMKWGFGWELGPFELWDAIGVKESVARMEQEGDAAPSWVKEMLESGFEKFYQDDSFYQKGGYQAKQINKKLIHLPSLKPVNTIFKNSGASLIDIGNEVALLEFHSLNHSIGLDVLQMITKSITEVEKNYKGLVLSHHGKNFCVGANLMMILLAAQEADFFEVEMVIRQFQQAMSRIRYAEKPVVSAPFGMTLGGGAEICLPSASVQASQETYIGLVETGVGLIPGGGGNKELYLRCLKKGAADDPLELQAAANHAFETIALAKVSTSAQEAIELGFLGDKDRIIANRDLVIDRAKQEVLHLSGNHYKPPAKEKIPVVGEQGYAALLMGVQMMRFAGRASEHDLKIAKKLAFVLAGGRVPRGTYVDEQYLLELEREAFLSLVGERKTLERMQHMLVKGKPLRN